MDFSRKDWAKARAVVDGVLDLLLKEIQSIIAGMEGLKVERYVRQGSSREGLKVDAPDEFDTILQFHFEGFSWEAVPLKKNGKIVPEFCYLEVRQSFETLQARLPQLCRKGAFSNDEGKVRINARAMHQVIFGSIIDQARENIMRKVNDSNSSGDQIFQLTRKINPPSINITIILKDAVSGYFGDHGSLEIDLDIVPGIVIDNEQVPDPSNRHAFMDCPVYAVFKWVDESSMKAEDFPNPEIVWRKSSSGVEKHTLDLVRFDRKQLYIITAMRVLKTYFVKTRRASRTPPQIVTVLKSYHLKQFAFYLILYACHIYPDAKIAGIVDALRYFFALLRASLEKKSLPHFFHSNDLVTRMYSSYPVRKGQLRFNLFRNKSGEALNQALLSLDNHLLPDLGFDQGDYQDSHLERVREEYTQGISVGIFF